jgi:hypothetical protein
MQMENIHSDVINHSNTYSLNDKSLTYNIGKNIINAITKGKAIAIKIITIKIILKLNVAVEIFIVKQ